MKPVSRRSALALLGSGLAGLAGCSGQPREEGVPVPEKSTYTPTADPPTPEPTERTEPARADHEAVRWWADLGNQPSGGLTVADGAVVVGTQPGNLDVGTPTTPVADSPVVALDVADGTRRWSVGAHAPARETPLVHDGTAYVACGFSTGFVGVDVAVYAVDVAEGSVDWRFSPDVHQFLSVLAATDDGVYVGAHDDAIGPDGAYTFAVDAGTGNERWGVETGDAFAGAVVRETLFVGSGSGLQALAVDSGSERWRHEPAEAISQPSVVDGIVIVEDRDGVVALDADGGDRVWQFSPEEGYVTRWELLADSVVARTSDGLVRALDATTGTERWEASVSGRGIAVVAVDDAVFVPSEREVVRLDADDGTEQWRYESDTDVGRTRAGGGTVYVADRDRTALVGLDAGDGTPRWEFGLDGDRVALATGDELAFAATADGFLYALDA